MTGPLGPEEITYERAKELARSDDASVRRALAEREDLSPELFIIWQKIRRHMFVLPLPVTSVHPGRRICC